MSDAIEAIRRWCEFGEYRVYVLTAVARRTHNDELTSNSEIVYREVLRREDDIEETYDDLRAVIGQYDYAFRIYLTVNARNTLDAYFDFREEMNGWIRDLTYGDEHAVPKLGELDSYWKSAIHSPNSRDEKYVLFDVDDVSEAEIDEFTADLRDRAQIHLRRETPNGYHVVSDPFNYTQWDPPVEYDELDADGQLFIRNTGENPRL